MFVGKPKNFPEHGITILKKGEIKMSKFRKRLSKRRSKRQFLEGAVKENKLNNKTVERGGIRL